MNVPKKAFRLIASAAALWMVCGAYTAADAQKRERIPVTHQDSPLTRDPRRPTAYEIQVEQQNAVVGKEVERALRDGNEATDAKPPRYEAAEQFYQEALKYNPKEARAYLGLGRLYAAQSRVPDSVAAFRKAIELKPKLAEAYFNLGMIYSAVGKKDSALEQYQVLQRLNGDLAKRLKEFIDK